MVLVFSVVLQGCLYKTSDNEHSPYFSISPGAEIILHKQVEIPRHQVAIYVQNGELKTYRDTNKYQPNCKFEVYTMSDQPRVVEADVFKVKRVVDEIETAKSGAKQQFASLQLSMLLDHSVVFNYATMMYLESEKQLDVYRMTCQHWEDIRDDQYLSVAEIRAAMGKVFSLNLAD